MRYEAKHNYLKKMGQNIGNFINIAWTLAMQHQYLQCYYGILADGLFEISDEVGPGILNCVHEAITAWFYVYYNHVQGIQWPLVNCQFILPIPFQLPLSLNVSSQLFHQIANHVNLFAELCHVEV